MKKTKKAKPAPKRTKAKSKKTSAKSDNKPTLVAFLLDRSGSMADCRQETISGFNGYVEEMRKKQARNIVLTLTQFDTQSIDIIHNAVPLSEVDLLTNETYQPRGGTSLYDAIGKTIHATEAAAGTKFKVLFVTLTDGEENSSIEWNSSTIKDLIKQKEEQNWTFAHIGVGANGWAQTQRLAAGTKSSSNVLRTTADQTGATYAALSNATLGYAKSGLTSRCVATNFFGGNGDSGVDIGSIVGQSTIGLAESTVPVYKTTLGGMTGGKKGLGQN